MASEERKIAMRPLIILVALLLLASIKYAAEEPVDLATWLMKTTFKIAGPDKANPNKSSIGTVFIIAKAEADNPTKGMPIMVTADHVLEAIAGDQATLFIRKRNPDGSYLKMPVTLPIRDKGLKLWLKHPKVDVAVMPVVLPSWATDGVPMLHLGFLADDEAFKQQDLRPGDELMCLGYPLGIESGPSGFPVLRSGRIASYPVYPSAVASTILYDFEVHGGNSGGPVFFEYVSRKIQNNLTIGETVQGIAGLVSMDISSTTKVESYFEIGVRKEPLGLGVVVPAQFIKEAIEMLPEKKKPEPKK